MVLFACREADRLVCAQLLLKRHGAALIGAQDFRGRTTLHLAAAKDSEAFVQALLDAGAPIDAVDYQHRTPLIAAVAGRADARIIDLLLQKGASIWPADSLGNTALHHACIEKLDDVGSLLVKRAPPPSPLHGGSRLFVDLQNERLQTALHLAIPAGMFETVSQILSTSQASLTMVDDTDRIPLLAGAESDDVADCMQIALSLMVPDAPLQSTRLSERMSLCSTGAGHARPSLASGHRKMSTYSGSDTELY
uniref:Uncharacterized protein n=1 Tax=Plectus sambesii TaxID=2011161 RepID=A0A914WNB7_9BILA